MKFLYFSLHSEPRGVEWRSGSPEGCQKVAGGRSASGDLRCAIESDATLKGSQNADALRSLTLAPIQGAKHFSMLTGGIAVLLRATAQPPATFWHAFGVQGTLVNSRFTTSLPLLVSAI